MGGVLCQLNAERVAPNEPNLVNSKALESNLSKNLAKNLTKSNFS